MAKKAKQRFVRIHKETTDFFTEAAILVDRETGVHYLMVNSTSGGGLTPLLGADGQPIVRRLPTDYDE